MLKNYYYNKLSIEERKTYDSMLKGYLARKRLINITSFPTQNVVEALNNEHPELFYVRINRILSCTGISGDSYIKPEYLYSKKEEENILAKARNITEQLKNNDEEMTVRSVHNFFVKHIKYDEDELHSDIEKHENHSMSGVFLNSIAVCEGFSKAFMYMLSLCGIDCTCVSGSSNGEHHMWNVVSLSGRNYYIDVTNDIGATEEGSRKPRYFYYLVTEEVMKERFTFSENFYCYSTAMNLFYRYNRVFFNKKDLKRYLSSVPKSAHTVYFQYEGRDMTYGQMSEFVNLWLPFRYKSIQANPRKTIYYFEK